MKRLLLVLILLFNMPLPFSVTDALPSENNPTLKIVFNPTGTHIKDGYLKIRLDFYPTEDDKTYNSSYVQVPNMSSENYTGEVDKKGLPLSREDYDNWLDSLPKIWVLNSCLSHFLIVNENVTEKELDDFVLNTFQSDVTTTIDNALTKENSLHLINAYMKDKTVLSYDKIVSEKNIVINNVNNRLDGYYRGDDGTGSINNINPESITVGQAAIDRGSSEANQRTLFNDTLQTNADGTITSIEVWFAVTAPDSRAGMVYNTSENDFTCRDNEEIGSITSGSKQTFSGLNMDTLTDDYLALYYDWDGAIDVAWSGGDGTWSDVGDNLDVDEGATYSFNNGSTYSLYGAGEETGGEEPPTVTMDNPFDTGEYYTYLDATISDNGSSNVTGIWFDYDFNTGTPYSYNTTGDWNPSWPYFDKDPLSGLSAGRAYYFRAKAINADNLTGYSAEKSTITSPYGFADVDIDITNYGENWISLAWELQGGQNYTSVRYQTETYPTDNVSGTQGYWGTGTSCNITGLDCETTYKISVFSIATDDGFWSVNTWDIGNKTQETAECPPVGELQPPANFTLTDLGGITVEVNWTIADNATYTLIRMLRDNYPSSINSGELVYYGTSNTTDIIGLDLSSINVIYHFSAWSFESDNTTYSNYYSIATIGGDMLLSHLLTLIPLLVLLILSLVFYGKGLVHLLTGSYALVLGYVAITGQWEILFFPIVTITVIIAIILFTFAMTKGDWL